MPVKLVQCCTFSCAPTLNKSGLMPYIDLALSYLKGTDEKRGRGHIRTSSTLNIFRIINMYGFEAEGNCPSCILFSNIS